MSQTALRNSVKRLAVTEKSPKKYEIAEPPSAWEESRSRPPRQPIRPWADRPGRQQSCLIRSYGQGLSAGASVWSPSSP